MNLAAASGEDLGTVADIVTDSMTGFGLEAKEAGKFADILATTSANANTNVSMLGEAFKYSAPIAGALGFSAEDTSLALGLMANSGIKASMAGTSLRSVMTRIAKPTKESGEALEALGIEFKNTDGSMRDLKDILSQVRGSMVDLDDDQKAMYSGMLAGQNAIGGLLAIVNASDADFKKLDDAILSSEGKSKQMADVMQDNLAGQLTQLKSALEGVGITLGNIIIPILSDLVKKYVMPLVSAFNNLSPAIKKTIVIGAGLVAVLGPIISMIGMVASGISALLPVLGAISLPMLGWVAGIGAVIAGLALLWKHNEEFRTKVIEVWDKIKSFFAVTFDWLKSLALQVWGDLKEFWDNNGEEISENFMKIWSSISDFLGSTFEVIKGLFVAVIAVVKALWYVFGDNILENVKITFNTIADIISGVFNVIAGILDVFIGLFTGDWSRMWEGVKKIFVGIFDVIIGVFDGFIGSLTYGIEKIKKFLGLSKEAEATAKNTVLTPKEVKKVVESQPITSDVAFSNRGLKLQKFATGGIVTRPTLAMIGEAGESEAVIPLSKLGKFGGGGVTINVTGNNIQDTLDVDIIADRIANKLKFAGVY